MSKVICTQLCSQTFKGVGCITTTEFDVSIETCISINNKIISNRCSTTLTTNSDQRCISSKVDCLCLSGEEVKNTCLSSYCDNLSWISCITTNSLISTDQQITSKTCLSGSDQCERVGGVVTICTTNLDLGDIRCSVCNITKEDIGVIRRITNSDELIICLTVTNQNCLCPISKVQTVAVNTTNKCAVGKEVNSSSCDVSSDFSNSAITLDFDVTLELNIFSETCITLDNQCSVKFSILSVNTNLTFCYWSTILQWSRSLSRNSQDCLIIRSRTVTTNDQSISNSILLTISEVGVIQEVSCLTTANVCVTNNIQVCTRISVCFLNPCIINCIMCSTIDSVNTKFKVTNCVGFSSECFSTNDTNFLPCRVRELNSWIL